MMFDTQIHGESNDVFTDEQKMQYALFLNRLHYDLIGKEDEYAIFLSKLRMKIMDALKNKYRRFDEHGNHFDGSKQQEKHAGLIFTRLLLFMDENITSQYHGYPFEWTFATFEPMIDEKIDELNDRFIIPSFRDRVLAAEKEESQAVAAQ